MTEFYYHHHRKHIYQPLFHNNYISVFNFPVELLHMQVVPEHFIQTSCWIILALTDSWINNHYQCMKKGAGSTARPLCQSWTQWGKRNERQLPVSWHVLQLHLETELRGQTAVAAEQTDRTEVRTCRETKKQTQRHFNRDSEEKRQPVVVALFSLVSVVKVGYCTCCFMQPS